MKRELCVLIAGVLCLGLCLTATGQDLTSGLEAYWNFDGYDGGNAVDASGNDRDAVIKLGQPLAASGKVGNGVFFDGGSNMNVPWTGVQGDTPRTIALWMKTTGGGPVFIAWGNNVEGEKWHFRINDNSGNGLVDTIRTEYAGGNQTCASTPVNDGEWHLICSVFDGVYPKDVRHYVDGVLDENSWYAKEETVLNTLSDDAHNVHIASNDGNGRMFNGTMDEIRIYSRALSDDEIMELYNQGKEPQAVAVRSFSQGFAGPGKPVDVTLDLPIPKAGELTEAIPDGWTASNISDGGALSGNTITWTLTESVTSVSYTAEPGEDASGSVFSGKLDGLITDGEVMLTMLQGSVGIFDFHADIGNVAIPGDAQLFGDEYEVTASGSDIWGTQDEFHFVFNELEGPFSITATNILIIGDGTNDWAKAGLMIRDELAADSVHYDTIMRLSDGFQDAQWRLEKGASSGSTSGNMNSTDNQFGDFRLVRNGDLMQTYYLDLNTGEWTLYDSREVVMEDPVYVGLCVTSHDNSVTNVGLFNNVEIDLVPFAGTRALGMPEGGVAPGQIVDVTVDLYLRETQDLDMTETPPAGWEISNIQASAGSASLDGSGNIAWTGSDVQGEMTMTYQVAIPETSIFFGDFSGTANGNAIEGQDRIIIPVGSAGGVETIAWWRFEEGSAGDAASGQIQDFGPDGESTGDFVGTIDGAPTFESVDSAIGTIDGLENNLALSFNGTSDQITGIPALPFGPSAVVTFEAIVNWAGPTESEATNAILQQYDGVGPGRTLLSIQNSGEVQTYIGGGPTRIPGQIVPQNQWVYIAATYADGRVSIWLDPDLSDGIQPDTHSSFTQRAFETNDGGLIIGNHKANDNFFNGQIAELRITTAPPGVERNPLETSLDVIADDAAAVDPQKVIAWWRFEEGTDGEDVGSIVKDFGPDGNSDGDYPGDYIEGFPTFTAVDPARTINPGKLTDSMALHFDGETDLIYTPGFGVTADTVVTTEAIVFWEGQNGSNSDILQQTDGEGPGRTWLYVNGGDYVGTYMGGAGTTSNVVVPANQWVWMASSYMPGMVAVWLDTDLSDGIQPQMHVNMRGDTMEDNEADFIIGRHKSQAGRNWNGLMAEVRITESGWKAANEPPAYIFNIGEDVPVKDWALY